ncbi:hypothetical protein AVEN_122100-1 [Araneus ventricosus]|uniref:Uncharacterized protein n=1 Tax=Araneus ventricosus TaxID=182803 RepID=A0A4Y2N4S6_ARAVE|nr:hypothetical protein AVEN_122100-1 [Araneus ventricosus]
MITSIPVRMKHVFTSTCEERRDYAWDLIYGNNQAASRALFGHPEVVARVCQKSLELPVYPLGGWTRDKNTTCSDMMADVNIGDGEYLELRVKFRSVGLKSCSDCD